MDEVTDRREQTETLAEILALEIVCGLATGVLTSETACMIIDASPSEYKKDLIYRAMGKALVGRLDV